jgi:hypothetical protein
MISQFLQSNLASWIVQVFVIASLGALLPVVFRIRHPRTQLAYTHFVLAVCVFLPLIQPWKHSIVSPDLQSGVTITYGAMILKNGIHLPIGWDRIAWAVLAAGFVFRLGWLAGIDSHSSLSNCILAARFNSVFGRLAVSGSARKRSSAFRRKSKSGHWGSFVLWFCCRNPF